jgi:hypothetical protein
VVDLTQTNRVRLFICTSWLSRLRFLHKIKVLCSIYSLTRVRIRVLLTTR